MKVLFYDTKDYDKMAFNMMAGDYPGIEMEYLKTNLEPEKQQSWQKDLMRCALLSMQMWEQRRLKI